MATRITGSYDYNVICDGCGRKMKASELRKRWDGFMMCKDDWEPRHSLDFYRTRNDSHKLPFTRPASNTPDVFTSVTYSGSYMVDPVIPPDYPANYPDGYFWINTKSGRTWKAIHIGAAQQDYYWEALDDKSRITA